MINMELSFVDDVYTFRAGRNTLSSMSLSEAVIIHQVQMRVDTMMAERKRQRIPATRDALQKKIAWELSRMASHEEAAYLTEHALKLFNTKGREYHACIGQLVMVTYEEQDCEGFFTHVDYMGHVKAVDPFDGICVQFGDDGAWWVSDEDEWEWIDSDLQELVQMLY